MIQSVNTAYAPRNVSVQLSKAGLRPLQGWPWAERLWRLNRSTRSGDFASLLLRQSTDALTGNPFPGCLQHFCNNALTSLRNFGQSTIGHYDVGVHVASVFARSRLDSHYREFALFGQAVFFAGLFVWYVRGCGRTSSPLDYMAALSWMALCMAAL